MALRADWLRRKRIDVASEIRQGGPASTLAAPPLRRRLARHVWEWKKWIGTMPEPKGNAETSCDDWLVIAGPLSFYSFDLYREIRRQARVGIRILHDPRIGAGTRAHDTHEPADFACMRWRATSTREIFRFIAHPQPAAVVVHGTFTRRPTLLLSAALPKTTPVVFVGDINVVSLAEQGLRAFAKSLFYRALCHRVDAAFALGLSNRLALEMLGFSQIFDVPCYPVNYERLDASQQRGSPVADSLAAAHDPGRRTALIVARLEPEKNVTQLLAQLGKHPDIASEFHVVVVGDGSEREAAQAAAVASPCLRTTFLGSIRPDGLGAVFACADLLVLPSVFEPWGIVVTEALGVGLPVVASPAVGAAVSLAGSTQAVVLADSPSAESVCLAMKRFLERQDALTEAGRAARTVVRDRFNHVDVATRYVTTMRALQSSS